MTDDNDVGSTLHLTDSEFEELKIELGEGLGEETGVMDSQISEQMKALSRAEMDHHAKAVELEDELATTKAMISALRQDQRESAGRLQSAYKKLNSWRKSAQTLAHKLALSETNLEERDRANRELHELNVMIMELCDAAVEVWDSPSHCEDRNIWAQQITDVPNTTYEGGLKGVLASHTVQWADGRPMDSEDLPLMRAFRGDTVRRMEVIFNGKHLIVSAYPVIVEWLEAEQAHRARRVVLVYHVKEDAP